MKTDVLCSSASNALCESKHALSSTMHQNILVAKTLPAVSPDPSSSRREMPPARVNQGNTSAVTGEKVTSIWIRTSFRLAQLEQKRRV